jgi:hypothetical protein
MIAEPDIDRIISKIEWLCQQYLRSNSLVSLQEYIQVHDMDSYNQFHNLCINDYKYILGYPVIDIGEPRRKKIRELSSRTGITNLSDKIRYILEQE